MLDPKLKEEVCEKFKQCSQIFVALGDPVRQQLFIEIADSQTSKDSGGLNVLSLASKTKLSRPAVSHHLKILKEGGLIVPVKDGTQNFYRLSVEKGLSDIMSLVKEVEKLISEDK